MRKKFVKVMFFGALALAVGTTTSCSDYDDDVKNLQEQIDQITATSPVSTEAMQKAVADAKAELQGEVDRVEGLLDGTVTEEDLTTEIKKVQDQLDAATGTEAANLAERLANLQNDLETLIDAKADDTYVQGLEDRIEDLESMEATLAKLIEAEQKYQANGDLSGYYDSAFDELINERIKGALESEGDIAKYVTTAVQSGVATQMSAINNFVAAKTGQTITTLEDFVGKVYNELFAASSPIKARLDALEGYTEAIDAFIAANKGTYADYADVLNQIEETRKALAALSTGSGDEGIDLNEAINAAVNNALTAADGVLETLKKELQAELDALKGLIQSVVYIPENLERSVNFSTVYAIKQNETNYSVVSKGNQEMQFRISGGGIASLDDFKKKYTISLNAEERNWTRDAGSVFDVEAIKLENNVLTVKVGCKDEKSYAVSLHIQSKAEEGATTATTDINSDYVAVIQGSYYITNAYLTVKEKLDGKIVYNDANSAAAFGAVGKLTVDYKAAADASTTNVMTDKEMADLNIASLFTVKYALDGAEKDYFNVDAAGNVKLKAEYVSIVDLLGKSVNLKGEVTSNYKLVANTSKPNPIELGRATIVRNTDNMSHTFATWNASWSNSEQANDDFKTADVYQNINVNISQAEYESLTVAKVETDVRKVRLEVDNSNGNALKVIIPAGIAAGDYTATATLKKAATGAEGDEYEVEIIVPVKVTYPEVETWAFTSAFYKNGMVYPSFSYTGSADKPTGITENYDLSNLFENVIAVEDDLPAGGDIVYSISNSDKFNGVSYTATSQTLTIDKDAYGLKDGEQAQNLHLKAEVKLGNNVIQTLEADIYIKDLSGSWKAGNLSVNLTDKAATVELAKACGLVWNDDRGFAMWQNGAAVVGTDADDSHYGYGINALDLYGLDAPTFAIVAVNGQKATESVYINVTSDGKVTFKEAGKDYEFVNPYTVTVKVTAKSQWGTIEGYNDASSTITLTVPAID